MHVTKILIIIIKHVYGSISPAPQVPTYQQHLLKFTHTEYLLISLLTPTLLLVTIRYL